MPSRSRLHGRVDRNLVRPPIEMPSTAVAPSRARGSKPSLADFPLPAGRVAPSRARGSKLCMSNDASYWVEVAPSRARGSKRDLISACALVGRSRLHGRVDRNTTRATLRRPRAWSRLHGRVDRNNQVDAIWTTIGRSRLHGRVDRNQQYVRVALYTIGRAFTGAWIETGARTPSPRRGQGRAFTGAWIETWHGGRAQPRAGVAPSRARGSKPCDGLHHLTPPRSRLHGRVDRNNPYKQSIGLPRRSRLHGRVDRNFDADVERCIHQRSRLHGRVDRNDSIIIKHQCFARVAPSRARGSKLIMSGQPHRLQAGRAFTGAWIETTSSRRHRRRLLVAPSRARGSKLGRQCCCSASHGWSRLHGRVDRNRTARARS